jgi:hypothetical protein
VTDPNKAVDYIIKMAPLYAKAKAERVYLEEFRKSKKAILMGDSTSRSLGAQERDAYAHPEYTALLEGLREAVLAEEKIRWELVAAQARIEIYRTESANNRALDRLTV